MILLAKDLIKDISEVISFTDREIHHFNVSYVKDYIRTLSDMLKLSIDYMSLSSEQIVFEDMLKSFSEAFQSTEYLKIGDKMKLEKYRICGYKTDSGYDTFVMIDLNTP